MTYPVIEKAEAVLDTINIVDYYGQINPNLSNRFLNEVDSFYDKIEKDPLRFPKVHENKRQAVLKIFPFQIIYEVDEKFKRVIVFSIFHVKRGEDYKLKR